MKFEAIVHDLIEELRASSPDSRTAGGASADALVAAGTDLLKEVVARVAATTAAAAPGAAADPGGSADATAAGTPEAGDGATGGADIEALVRRVVSRAREVASQDRADLVRQLSRPDLLLNGRGRAAASDEVTGRVEL